MLRYLPLRQPSRTAVIALLALALAGCDKGGGLEVVSETDEKQYQYAQQMKREGHPDEALAAYLRVVRKRQGDAPESNLEAGTILLNVKKDPVAAIYHFQEYLAVKPDSEQAPMVKQLIETAKKDFARTLPGQPYSTEYDRVDLLEQIRQLRSENDTLRRQSPSVQPMTVTAVSLDNPSASGTAAARTQAGLQQRPPTLSQPATETPPAPASTRPTATAPASTAAGRPTAAAVTGTRTHTVADKDTLMVISLKYYGTRNRWRDILNANRDQLPNEDSKLKPGMLLKIPQ